MALGSPHGDDRIAWVVAEQLREQVPDWITIRNIGKPLDVLDTSPNTRGLILLDACRGAGEPGSLHRFTWPDTRLRSLSSVSSHGFDLVAAIELLESLGRRPQQVIVFAIELESACPNEPIGEAVGGQVDKITQMILSDLEALLAASPDAEATHPVRLP